MVRTGNVTLSSEQLLDEELLRYRQEAEETQQRLVDFLSVTTDITWELDEHLRFVRRQNPSDGKSWCSPSHSDSIGKTVPELLGADPETDRMLAAHMDDLKHRRPFRGFVHSIQSHDGKVRWLETNGNPIFSRDGVFRGYRGTTRDITRRKTDEARIVFLAHHDWLTNLPNRALLRKRLQDAFENLKPGELFSVLVLDIDDFKLTNDTQGHTVGDRLLTMVGERLSACVRHLDTVARVGGDEFAIVQVGLEQESDAAAFARRISDLIAAPFDIDGHRVMASASIGMSIAPRHGREPEQVLRNAEVALAEARKQPGSWRLYEPEMSMVREARRNLELELREALEKQQFELYYQPFFTVKTGDISAFEALLRWKHPERGLVMPDSFIPAAEETGLIVPLGEWVLREACREAATWPGNIAVSVNLSSVQFRNGGPVEAVKRALSSAKLASCRLQLEITESVLMQNTETTLAALHELRNLGMRISMDDFGTGYSSLGYLRSFPFDKIKIDRSFIQDLTQKQSGIAIVHAITLLGTSLRLATIAEGIETKEQFEIVKTEGCTEVQGFLFGRPKPAAQIREMMAGLEPVSQVCGSRRECRNCASRTAAPPEIKPQRLFSDFTESGEALRSGRERDG